MRTISVTEGLIELKLYDKKIEDAIDALAKVAITEKRKGAETLGVSGSIDEFEKKAKAAYQKVTDYMRNRDQIKTGITQSNATTHLSVAGVDMTRAQAIELKTSIVYKQRLLQKLKNSLSGAVARVCLENKRVDQEVAEMKQKLVEKDTVKKLSADDFAFEESYRAKNEYELFDPLKLAEKIDTLEAEIDAFLSSVDSALTISNSTTFIEVE